VTPVELAVELGGIDDEAGVEAGDEDDAETDTGAEAGSGCGACEKVEARGCGAVLRGGLLEPGHRFFLGPCWCMVPSFRCSCPVTRQQLHMPLDLLAPCDKLHDCLCDMTFRDP
jgi:hypothetical protein